jgi:CheY-like chemotaxis protein
LGSTFSFAIPLEVQTDETKIFAISEGSISELPLAPLRILLTEDSPDNCIITLAYLEGTPYTVEVAENGAMACEMFRAGNYDLVLMDRQMPLMDGLEAARNIRAWESSNGRDPVPIIALTASALKGDRETCIAAGCSAFLTKPIRQSVLLQAIREHTAHIVVALGNDVNQASIRYMFSAERLALQSPRYLANCRENSVKMLAALENLDLETVATLGHNLAGSGTSFGFPVISAIGATIQTTAEAADQNGARDGILSLIAFLDVTCPPKNPSP